MDFSNSSVESDTKWFDAWLSSKSIRPVDLQWIHHLQDHVSSQDESVLLSGVLVSAYLGAGHTCIDLTAVFNGDLAGLEFHPAPSVVLSALDIHSVGEWYRRLSDSPLVALFDGASSHSASSASFSLASSAPLILTDAGLLYLARYFSYEQSVLSFIQLQESKGRRQVDGQKLDALFPSDVQSSELDWQKIAVANAASMDFSIISGGPGTGKTTTVTKLLALLVWQSLDEAANEEGAHFANEFRESDARLLSNALHKSSLPRIALAAPTGKAAARLTESISGAKKKLDIAQPILDAIPETATTLHRLLGADYGRSQFKHHKQNPLHIDILLVDEVSMVDMPMMAKLIEALPEHARLVLLGDKDQLSSVEAGNVLGDLTFGIQREKVTRAQFTGLTDSLNAAELERLSRQVIEQAPAIQRHLSLLSKSYRFNDQSGIGLLASAVNQCQVDGTLRVLLGDYDNVYWRSTDLKETQLDVAALAQGYKTYWAQVRQRVAPAELHTEFNQYQVLTAVRQGVMGVEFVNDALETYFYRQGYIESQSMWYPGKAIIMTRNDSNTGLFNGDIGLCLPDEQNVLRVWFTLANGEMKGFLPSRITSFEPVFAMTVHKSQGSEFERVTMILPNNASPVLGKELIYTGITRAKHYFELWANEFILQDALKKRVQRRSGLTKAIWR
ncbi:exodeoxyribonuclease V subunit alpha [Marinomonas mediterranea]|uniref:exodeoxyribonuclease V subunit alpha n=1 Tax=Marinomonas mediterranea TaxID=119864 RepID=UPI002349E7B1|nr:exodeoxyribonuclease V subunit alpha [Marinomonas mediterranea]WCN14039.1 exodeoxyribonuclease V subunit alpha [Marinomonas mediterranea]